MGDGGFGRGGRWSSAVSNILSIPSSCKAKGRKEACLLMCLEKICNYKLSTLEYSQSIQSAEWLHSFDVRLQYAIPRPGAKGSKEEPENPKRGSKEDPGLVKRGSKEDVASKRGSKQEVAKKGSKEDPGLVKRGSKEDVSAKRGSKESAAPAAKRGSKEDTSTKQGSKQSTKEEPEELPVRAQRVQDHKMF